MKRLAITLVVLVLAGLTQILQAQVRGIPPSVTSLAPGRQFMPGPSVTSLGPNGWDNSPVLLGNPRFRGGFIGGGPFVGHGGGFRHSRGHGYVPVFVPLYTPYAMGVYPMIYTDPSVGYDPAYSTEVPANYQSFPDTATENTARPPVRPRSQPAVSQADEEREVASAEAPSTQHIPVPVVEAQPQPKTVLVFKDGHKLEVTNYVIQGETLFNLGDGGPRKVAVNELDLNKTISENDNRGVTFSLP